MFYTVYKITNILNDKFYIGKHQTKYLDDGYMGSGKLLKFAYEKYGIDKFTKEILFIFDNEEDMNKKEKELVVICEQSYNLCDGGMGGFSYINRSGKALRTGMVHSEESKKKMGHPGKAAHNKGKKWNDEQKANHSVIMSNVLKGKLKSEEHKRKIAETIKRKHQERLSQG